jgi:hypothetical protein
MKKLVFIGLLLIAPPLVSNLSARTNYLRILHASNDLSERLAADKDFQDYVFFSYELTGKVLATQSAKLFKKVFDKIASKDEESKLLNNLGFDDRNELNRYLYTNLLKANSFYNKFSELRSLTNSSEIILSAARKVVTDNKLETKVVYRPLTCWEQFFNIVI